MNKLSEHIVLAAHRGDQAHAPENTMHAFERAIRLGVDMIETDIHMSSDGVMFIMHDDLVDRTTNGHGFAHQMTWKELQALDAGSWYGPQFAGTTIPSLEEFMAFVQATPGLWVNWELKDYPEVCGQNFALRSADGLLRAIADYDLTDRSMLNSFSSEVLEYVAAESCGEMPIHGQGVAPTSRMHGKATRAPQDYWDWACLYTDDHTIPSEPHYAACKALGIQPCVCIKDTLENYEKSVRLGCRMFTSNDPETAARLLRELGVRDV